MSIYNQEYRTRAHVPDAQRHRNPLDLEQQDEIQWRKYKSTIDNPNKGSNDYASRPIGRQVCETTTNQTTAEADFRPSIKPVTRTETTQLESRTGKMRVREPYASEGNPILQDRCAYDQEPARPKPAQYKQPSTALEQTNDKRHLLPSERGGLSNSSRTYYSKYNTSNIFAEAPAAPQPRSRQPADYRPDTAKSMLTYDYALPYRNQDLTGKVNEGNHTEIRQQTVDNGLTQAQAQVFAARRNQTTIKFSHS